jgi:hypothetical protein
VWGIFFADDHHYIRFSKKRPVDEINFLSPRSKARVSLKVKPWLNDEAFWEQ